MNRELQTISNSEPWLQQSPLTVKSGILPGGAVFRAYRALQPVLCLTLVCGCAYLAVGLRAVPARELWTVLLALLYGACFSAASCKTANSSCSSGSYSNDVIVAPVPLSGFGYVRIQTLFLLATSAFLSVGAPWAWILLGEPSPSQIKLLSPHLFVMMSQIIFELRCNRVSSHVLLRLSIPVAASAYRIGLLLEWSNFAKETLLSSETPSSEVYVMCGLAYANLFFWGFVLFYFLLVKVAPRYFAAMPVAICKSQ